MISGRSPINSSAVRLCLCYTRLKSRLSRHYTPGGVSSVSTAGALRPAGHSL